MHSAVRNVMRLFDRIKDFEKRVLAREPALGRREPRRAARGARRARADARPARPAPRRGAVDRARQRRAQRTDAVARRIVAGARMSTQTAQSPARAPRQRTRSCATGLACHRCDNSYPLERHGLRLPGLRQGPRRRLRLRAGGAPLQGLPERRAPAQHLALRGAAADRRRARAGARRAVLRLHAADPRRPARRRARARATCT